MGYYFEKWILYLWILHRLKTGGFKLRLKAGSFHLKAIYSTLKSSSGSLGFWFLIYSFQTSSVTFPLEATQYPLAHRCCPQYLFFSDENSHNSLWELFPFRNCTARDTDNLGGMPISMCTWSLLIEPAYMIISLLRAISRSNSRHLSPTSPPSIG